MCFLNCKKESTPQVTKQNYRVVYFFLTTVAGANIKTIDRKEAIGIRKARQLYLCSAFHTLN